MRAFGKRVDAVEVIPVGMRDDDVRHCLRWHTGPRHGGVGPLVVDRLPSCDQIGTLEADIDEYHASPRAFQQPDDTGCSDAAPRVGTGDRACDARGRQRAVANCIGFPCRHRRGTDAVQVRRTARFCVSHRLVSYVRHDRNADSRVTTRCLTPSGTCWVDRYGPAFPSTTAAFRRSPASFARFIGDFRNAALNCS